jgi:hypothetical protein
VTQRQRRNFLDVERPEQLRLCDVGVIVIGDTPRALVAAAARTLPVRRHLAAAVPGTLYCRSEDACDVATGR